MAEAKGKEKAEAKEKGIELTLSKSPYSYYNDWKSVYFSYAPPEIVEWLNEFDDLGIPKWQVLAYILAQYIDKDPLQIGKEVLAFHLDLVVKWKKMMELEGKK